MCMRGARVCSLINIFHTSFFFLIQNLDGNDGKYEAHKCFLFTIISSYIV